MASGFIQIGVVVGNDRNQMFVQLTDGVDDFYRRVSKELAFGIRPEDLSMTFADSLIIFGHNEKLGDYNITHQSTIQLLFRPQHWDMAEKKDEHAIPVGAIPNWVDYSDENRDKLTELAQPPAKFASHKSSPVDWEINTKISLFAENIACLKVDGIVSPSNTQLNPNGACASAISKAAGPELAEELKTLKGCETGEAKTTGGYNLPAIYIVHTVGPSGGKPLLLAKCYDSCLAEMEKHHMRSLAFSCISTGGYGFPAEEAARIALQQVRKYLDNRKKMGRLGEIDRIIFCVFDEETFTVYERWLQIYFPCGSEDEYVEWLTQKKEQELQPLTGFIGITTTEPDMVTFDDDPNIRRAKMPCGHVIGTDSMTTYCKGISDSGGFVFNCPDPSCDAKWQYFLVRHVASLTSRQMQVFEQRISQNYIRREEGTRQCPQCHVMCRRKNPNHPCVQCTFCTLKTKQNYYFCWECLGDWKGGNGSKCGNRACAEGDERIATLAKCSFKKILNRDNAPSVRGCPKCGLLIEYLSQCTQMHCRGCGHYFCFLCLKGAKTKKELTCRAWDSNCTIAPIQTTLPGM